VETSCTQILLSLGILLSMGTGAFTGSLEDDLRAAQSTPDNYCNRIIALVHAYAEGGNSQAQNLMGSWYRRAPTASVLDSPPGDFGLAARCFKRSAEQGYAQCQCDLGYMYEEGWGVPKDTVLAYAWYTLAAAQDLRFAAARENIAFAMTPAQVSEGQAVARRFVHEGE
jgi:TPR repeat protein